MFFKAAVVSEMLELDILKFILYNNAPEHLWTIIPVLPGSSHYTMYSPCLAQASMPQANAEFPR